MLPDHEGILGSGRSSSRERIFLSAVAASSQPVVVHGLLPCDRVVYIWRCRVAFAGPAFQARGEGGGSSLKRSRREHALMRCLPRWRHLSNCGNLARSTLLFARNSAPLVRLLTGRWAEAIHSGTQTNRPTLSLTGFEGKKCRCYALMNGRTATYKRPSWICGWRPGLCPTLSEPACRNYTYRTGPGPKLVCRRAKKQIAITRITTTIISVTIQSCR